MGKVRSFPGINDHGPRVLGAGPATVIVELSTHRATITSASFGSLFAPVWIGR